MSFGLGDLNVSPDEFYSYSMEEFAIKSKHHFEKTVDDWRKIRSICYSVSLPYMKRKVTQEKFWPLPGDKKNYKLSKNKQKVLKDNILARMREAGIRVDNKS